MQASSFQSHGVRGSGAANKMKFVFCGGVYAAKYTLRGESVFCPLQEGKTRGSERIFFIPKGRAL